MFRNPVDIANRGLQQCGSPRLIDDADGFNEDSVQATNCAFVYDKLRRAELRRNLWRFAIKHAILRPVDSTFRQLSAPLWASTSNYFMGSIVGDAMGTIWVSQTNDNVNNEPGNSAEWQAYFGPVAVPPYDSTATVGYYAGDVVYVTPGDGTAAVYMSLVPGNSDNPSTTAAYDATVMYGLADLVLQSSTPYQSLIDFNLNNLPSATTAPAAWAIGTTYAINSRVRGTDGYMYLAAQGANTGHDPVGDDGTWWTATGALAKWTSTLTRTSSSSKWMRLDNAVLRQMFFAYPIGAGPVSDPLTRNVYRLPAGYLRKAPQDPKAGSVSALGAPSNLPYDDWLYEGNYIVSRSVFPIQLRFGADMNDVRDFDDMFCEMLGCRIGYEVAPAVTQSGAKRSEIASAYNKFRIEAVMVNGIETGSEEPPLDDWLACRA